MVEVKLSTPAPNWPWARQTPGSSGCWGDLRFYVDQDIQRADAWVVFESLAAEARAECPPDRVVFVTGEPSSIGCYHPGFLAQFSHVVTGIPGLTHPNVIRRQQGHPWFVEKSFDELIGMEPPEKVSSICLIVSSKSFTPGHRERLAFTQALRSRLDIDVFGRGIRDFASKWDLLAPYRYAIVLENAQEEHFITEKLPDALLAFCYPFYVGCPNAGDYFPAGSWQPLTFSDVEESVDLIHRCVGDPLHYARVLPAVGQAREHYLRQLQFFPNLQHVLEGVVRDSAQAARPVRLLPNAHFAPAQPVTPPAGRMARAVRGLRELFR